MADSKDSLIINILKRNARESNVQIAREVGLTEGAVRRRIDNLIANGTIRRFTIDISSESGVYAVVMVKAKGETKKTMSDISSIYVAKSIYEIAGEYDGVLILEAGSLEELDRNIDRIRKLKSVRDTNTYVSLKKY